MTSETRDNFENGIFWELYNDLECQFENFLEYVPYLEDNMKTYSFKLLNLILSIGGHIDSAFKEMARYPDFSANEDCKKILEILTKSNENIRLGEAPLTVPIWLSLRAFEKEYKLSAKKVIFKRLSKDIVMPFRPYIPKTNAPEWWEIYNGLKHDVSVNIKQANLRNTLHALAGAFLLNVIHLPAYIRSYEIGILKPSLRGPAVFTISAKGRENLKDFFKKGKLFGLVETPLFIYDHGQWEDLTTK